MTPRLPARRRGARPGRDARPIMSGPMTTPRRSSRLVLPGRFEAAIFDNDGLIVDSEPAWAAAEAELFARHGAAIGPADVADTHGRSVEATVELYAASLGAPVRELHDELMADSAVALRPRSRCGRVRASCSMRWSGRMRLAVASNSPTDLVELGLQPAWAPMTASTSSSRPPTSAVRNRRRMSISPSAAASASSPPTAIAFEDSDPGRRRGEGRRAHLRRRPGA